MDAIGYNYRSKNAILICHHQTFLDCEKVSLQFYYEQNILYPLITHNFQSYIQLGHFKYTQNIKTFIDFKKQQKQFITN
jgi:hypothetical protein